MAGIADEIKASFRNGTAVVKLIYINLAVFVIVRISAVVFSMFSSNPGGYTVAVEYFKDNLLTYLLFPADFMQFVLKPWTIISYMFLHFDFLHILFNMLWLFWFGRIFMKYLTEKQLYTTYLIGGIAGAILFMIAYNILPGLNQHVGYAEVLGASAAVTAIIIGVSFYAPNDEVYLIFIGPVKLKYIALVYIVLDVLQLVSANAGGHIAHLGGALYGYLFATQLHKGKDISSGFSSFADGVAVLFKRKPRMKVSYKSKARQMDDFEYNKQKAETQKEIDRILDKIAKSGYDSLSKKEKETLFRMSKKG